VLKRLLPCLAWSARAAAPRALRRMESDHGWISTPLTSRERANAPDDLRPHRAASPFERLVSCHRSRQLFSALPVVATAHRVTGYFEEEAVHSYTEYLAGVENGTHANVPAPKIAIDYWKLSPDARLRDVIIAVRADEIHHRDVNHRLADELAGPASGDRPLQG
jgi:ubiquinol oxidase